jgi:hypothetical protein
VRQRFIGRVISGTSTLRSHKTLVSWKFSKLYVRRDRLDDAGWKFDVLTLILICVKNARKRRLINV